MKIEVEIVDNQDIHRGQAEPVQTVFVRAHDAVVTEIDLKLKRQRVRP